MSRLESPVNDKSFVESLVFASGLEKLKAILAGVEMDRTLKAGATLT